MTSPVLGGITSCLSRMPTETRDALIILRRSLVLVMLAAGPLLGQTQSPPSPILTAAIGAGNETGGYGGLIEWHSPLRNLSLFTGVGRNLPGGLSTERTSWSAGLRTSAGTVRHRVLVSIARNPLILPLKGHPDPRTRYGIAVSLGYRFIAHRGFTGQIAAGAGYAAARSIPSFRDPAERVATVNLGLGYTWRRR